MENFKRMLKKAVAVLMIAVLLIGIAPIGSLADVDWSEFALTAKAVAYIEGDYGYTVTNDEAYITSYTGSDVVITTPSYLGGYPVTAIDDEAFYDSSVEDVTVSHGVEKIGVRAFFDCYNLRSIKLPDTLVSIGGSAFSYCYSLSEIVVPDSVLYINAWAFQDCSAMKRIVLSKNLEFIGEDVFRNCVGLEELIIDSNNLNFSTENGVLFNKDKTTLIQYPLGASKKEYVVPDSVKTIEYLSFSRSTNLEKISIPGNVERINESAFQDCEKLVDIVLNPGLNTIGEAAFYDCDSLKSIIIPDTVTSMGLSVFGYCKSLEHVKLSSGLISIVAEAFYSCENLKMIVIPEGIEYIAYDAFHDCESLETILISDSVTSFGNGAFYGCSSLKTMEVPDGQTYVGSYTFAYCTSLESVVINDDVSTIGSSAFSGCSKLKDVYYTGSEEEWNNIVIRENNTELTNATIHFNYVPHKHNFVLNKSVDPTCKTSGERFFSCSCGANYTENVPATGQHDFAVNIPAVSATCISTGLTAGKKCSGCDKVMEAQKVINKTGHKEVTLAGKAATYTSTGLTAGKKCSVCGKITVAQKTIAKLTLGKVSGLKAKKVKVAKSSEITLAWNKVTGAKSYEVYQKSGSKWKKIKTTSSTSYTVKNLKADKEYQFKVRAVVDGASGAYSSVLTVETIPETTSKLTLKAGKKQLTASWSKVSDISGYEISYSTSKKFSKKTTKVVKAKKSSKKTTIKKLTKNKKYYVRIRTYKTVNGKKVYSDWSKVKSVKVK